MSKWQPIETAPQDGTLFLAVDIIFGQIGVLSLDNPDGLFMDHGFQYVTETPEPTHWHPLPELPEGSKC